MLTEPFCRIVFKWEDYADDVCIDLYGIFLVSPAPAALLGCHGDGRGAVVG